MTFSILVAVVAVIVAGVLLYKLKASSGWVSTEGTILESGMEMVHRSPGRQSESGVIDYKVNIRYRYSVEGREYTSSQIMAGIPNVVDRKTDAEDLVARFHKGAEVEVFHDPSNPANAALITGKSIPVLGFVVIAGFIVVVVVCFFFVLRFMRQAA